MNIKKLKVGDVVVLKSGGLPMTICDINISDKAIIIIWLDTTGIMQQAQVTGESIQALTYAKE